jgi:hypothetical protein
MALPCINIGLMEASEILTLNNRCMLPNTCREHLKSGTCDYFSFSSVCRSCLFHSILYACFPIVFRSQFHYYYKNKIICSTMSKNTFSRRLVIIFLSVRSADHAFFTAYCMHVFPLFFDRNSIIITKIFFYNHL